MGFNDRERKRVGHGVVSAMLENPMKEENEMPPKGKPKVSRETKKRVSLVILPSLYADVQKIAYVERTSISEIVSSCLERYAKDNAEKLTEYERIVEQKM